MESNLWKPPKSLNEKRINVNYEKFVLNHEKETKDIINKLSLNWENSLKNYNKNDRPVETASLHQVRGKIIKNTSEQWKQYSDYLIPMQNILKLKNILF